MNIPVPPEVEIALEVFCDIEHTPTHLRDHAWKVLCRFTESHVTSWGTGGYDYDASGPRRHRPIQTNVYGVQYQLGADILIHASGYGLSISGATMKANEYGAFVTTYSAASAYLVSV